MQCIKHCSRRLLQSELVQRRVVMRAERCLATQQPGLKSAASGIRGASVSRACLGPTCKGSPLLRDAFSLSSRVHDTQKGFPAQHVDTVAVCTARLMSHSQITEAGMSVSQLGSTSSCAKSPQAAANFAMSACQGRRLILSPAR